MASSRTPFLTTVLVLCEDEVVGRALELLLRSVDYDVQFLEVSSLDELETFDDVGLVLLCPGLSSDHRQTILTLLESTPVTDEISIVELVENPDDVLAGSRHLLPWPCRAEHLKHRIDAILLDESGVAREVGL